MEALKAFEFGHLIAFVIPGLVATRALAYYVSALDASIKIVTTGGEGALGPVLVLLISGVSVGLTLSVFRQQWLDPIHGRIYGKFKDRAPEGKDERGRPVKVCRPNWRPNYGAIRDRKDLQEFYDHAISQVYRYYQFIANMAIALFLLYAARLDQYGCREPVTIGVVVVALLLEITAYQQFKGWCRVHNQITGGTATSPTGA